MRMRFVCPLALAGAMLAAGAPTSAQKQSEARGVAEKKLPIVAAATQAAAERPKVLPEVNVKGIALADLIDFLRDPDPAFQAVISYAPGVEPPGPIIQELRLKNVTADSVLEVLKQAYPYL